MKKSNQKTLGLRGLFLVLLLVAVSNTLALAQVTASISGRIEDPSGAAVPSAAVTATNLETGATRTVAADEAGNYRVLSLPVGQYEIRAEKVGFKATVQTRITLVVGQQAVVNLKLELGEVQQQVTVTSEAPVVNTTTASVSGLVGERAVKDLPLNGRSFDKLIALNPSAVNFSAHNTTAASGVGAGNSFVISGRRSAENLVLMNGVEYTGAWFQMVTPGGVSGQMLGIDAVREFNVMTDAYSAEYGKRPGGQVTVVTQSGTNHLHGSLFEFLRNSDLDARNFFDQSSVPPFKRNQFGGAAGGPIRKDKTFIFGNYEGFRQRLGLSSLAFVPDLNARQGLLPDAQGVPARVTNLNPGILPYMAYWPLPNGPTLGGGVAEYFSNPNQSIREDFGNARIDHYFSDKDTVSGIYTIDDGYNSTPPPDPLFSTIATLRSQIASAQEVHIFSPEMINTARVGYSRGSSLFDSFPLGTFPANLSWFTGRKPGLVTIGGSGQNTSIGNITSGGGTSPAILVVSRNLFTYSDDVQLTRGKHQISFGAWVQRLRDNENAPPRFYGTAAFASLQAFLQGTVTSLTGVGKATREYYRMWMGAWYVQDNITLRPNLTLRLGLRHEFDDGWNEAHGNLANYVTDSSGVLLTNPIIGKAFTENNAQLMFEPRVGLAWDPFGNGKTSVRAGAGIYYHLQDALSFEFGGIQPFNGLVTFGANTSLTSLVPIPANYKPPQVCGPGVPQPCTIYSPQGVQSTMKPTQVQEWNLAIEQQITANTSLRAAYVGSHGIHELIGVDLNAIHPQICSNPSGCTSGGVGSARGTVPQGGEYIPVGTRPNPYLSNSFFWNSGGNSSYNALQLDVTRRFDRGLQLRANYTWAKNLSANDGWTSNVNNDEPQVVMTPYSPKRDWGPSGGDFQHQANISGSYELPFGKGKPWLAGASGAVDKLASGWQMNWIVSLLSGFPITPQVGSNQSGDGDTRNPDRVSANPSFNGKLIIGSSNQWFNPNAYILPVAGTYGNVGRGAFRGPGMGGLDLSLFKTTPLTEGLKLEFRAECFNLTNHSNFNVPNPLVFSGGKISPTAGVISATTTTSRQIQFGLKLVF